MPKVPKSNGNGKPKAAPAAKPKPAAPAKEMRPAPKIVHDHVAVNGVPIPMEKTVTTLARMIEIMGWEPEDEYVARRIAANPALTLKADTIRYGDDYLLIDNNGQKVRCSFNAGNRPFDLQVTKGYEQDHINGKFRFNCETFIISKHGHVISGQKRGVAFILACQRWHKNPTKYKAIWPEEPVFRTLIVTGADDAPEVIATIDNVQTRKLSDTFYTSPIFADMDSDERKRHSMMLDTATDFLWKRVGAGFDESLRHQTHAASHDFLKRHERLIRAVKHMGVENASDAGRPITKLRLSAGHCAALLYLFGASGTEPGPYREAEHPTEKLIDFKMWDKAEEFFTMLTDLEGKTMAPLRKVLQDLVDSKHGTKELNDKKIVAVIKAWKEYSAGKSGAMTVANIQPDLVENQAKEKVLDIDKLPTAGGIDLGSRPEPDDDDLTPEEVEAAKAKADEDRAKKLAKKKGGKPQAEMSPSEKIADLRKTHDGAIILFETEKDKFWSAWEEDSERVEEVLPTVRTKIESLIGGMRRAFFPPSQLSEVVELLRIKLGRKVLLATKAEDGKVTIADAPATVKPPPLPGKPATPTTSPAPAAPAVAKNQHKKGGIKKAPVPTRGGLNS